MNILLIGGCSNFINSLINKLNKEGHRIYLLTGDRYEKSPYQKVFEKYRFEYDSSCIADIFESINPDVTVFTGAYDTNFTWENNSDAVKFTGAMTNILMGYMTGSTGKFVYLSSHEVFSGNHEDVIPDDTPTSPADYKGTAIAQGEEMCLGYRRTSSRDIVILRLDHMYGIPDTMKEVTDMCSKMCLEAINKSTITIYDNHTFSLLYQSDAIEQIYRVIKGGTGRHGIYQISSKDEVTERELAETVRKNIWFNIEIISLGDENRREILSGERYREEYGGTFYCNRDDMIKRISEHMRKYQRFFLYGDKKKKTLKEKLLEGMTEGFRRLVPYLENFAAFIIFFMLNNRAVGSTYFSKLDLYLIYVLIFAMVYGQQMAIISGILAVFGYLFRQMYDRSGFELMLDTGTYIWMAQLFIIGLSVGYLHDNIKKLKREQDSEERFLSNQLTDIRDINDTNVRVKEAIETQLVNQNDSVGKIYRITSALDQYSQEEVLFYAADTIGKIMKTDDVAVYTVSNGTYARLFSATSEKARCMGNSIRYTELGEVYEAFLERKVYINKKLKKEYPLMANAVYDDENRIQIIIMIWGLPWESMTLGQMNQLVVVSSLIGNAVLRANRYLRALEEERFIEGTKLMESDAFTGLLKAYVNAEKKGWTQCTVLELIAEEDTDIMAAGQVIAGFLRQHDYVGMSDGKIYVLLSNTREEEAVIVVNRIAEKGYSCRIVEGDEI